MQQTKQVLTRKLFHVLSGVFLVVSVVILVILGFLIAYQDRQDTYASAEETAAFLNAECQKYDNYTRGLSARSRQDLLDKAIGIKTFLSPAEMEDNNFLEKFIYTEHVGGVLVLDAQLQPLAQADMDHQDSYALWKETIQKEMVQDVLAYPKKTYVDTILISGVSYDLAMTAMDDGSRLILCYASTEKPSTDPYELTLRSILANNNFHKNPTVVIADGTQVLSTNSEVPEKLNSQACRDLADTIQWEPDQLTRFCYDGSVWYGLRRVSGKYFTYIVYPSNEVFSNRTNFFALAFMGYLALCVVVLSLQRRTDRATLRSLEKQLRIIRAISTGYDSTFLLHLDRRELEPVRPSERLKQAVKEYPQPRDFLTYVCQTEVSPEHRADCADFLTFDTIAERLQGQSYLGREFKDIHGTWYSVLLIPQRYDEAGNIQAVLVTTRDVTTIKQAEELSFKDKLTGLRNRNYMESRGQSFIRAGDLPVSLIMADCNYLKRTNDTLGHEYGDLLLQRVAGILQESIPKDGIAIRVGGDEFLLVCPHCTQEEAHQLIARVKRTLAERSDETLTLSVSFGVAALTSQDDSFAQAYEQADQEMYRDKQASHAGRG